MALSVTLLGSVTFTTASGTKSVSAFPEIGKLIVVVTMHTGNTSSATPTDDFGGTYTTITTALKNSSADTMMVHVRTALTTSDALHTITHAPGTTTGGGLMVFIVGGTSLTGSSAIRQSAKVENQAGGTVPTPVFSSAALTTNAVLGAVFNATNGSVVVQRTGYTELSDSGYATPNTGQETMVLNSGETATSIAWGGNSGSAYCAAVIEIDATLTLTPTLFTNSNTFYAPTVSFGSGGQTLSPPLFANAQTFYGPTVSASYTLLPVLFTNTNAFYAATVTDGSLTLAPSILVNSGAFFAPVVKVGAPVSNEIVNTPQPPIAAFGGYTEATGSIAAVSVPAGAIGGVSVPYGAITPALSPPLAVLA
jgi:hypothetical protein